MDATNKPQTDIERLAGITRALMKAIGQTPQCQTKWREQHGPATKWVRSADKKTVFRVCDACADIAAKSGCWKISKRPLLSAAAKSEREFAKAFTPNKHGEYA